MNEKCGYLASRCEIPYYLGDIDDFPLIIEENNNKVLRFCVSKLDWKELSTNPVFSFMTPNKLLPNDIPLLIYGIEVSMTDRGYSFIEVEQKYGPIGDITF
jgi:hypothetical protein